MKEFEQNLSKKNVLHISLLGTLLWFLFAFGPQIGVCQESNYSCIENLQLVSVSFDVFLITLFFSLITFKLNETTFKAWRKFAFYWVPATALLVSISPTDHNLLHYPSLKDLTDLFMVTVFFVASIIIILKKLYTTRVKK